MLMSKKNEGHNKNRHVAVSGVNKTVHRIHFEDYSSQDFERLSFSYISELKEWTRIQWLGQTGNDRGRDIWGVLEGESYCYQCANYQKLQLKKVTDDINKLFHENFIPDNFIVICGGTVSVKMRNDIIEYAGTKRIKNAEVWSGVEFEERLRKETPLLIERFVKGEAFPNVSDELIKPIPNFKTPEDFFNLIKKYRANKEIGKLQELLLEIIDTAEFENIYAEKLNTLIFCDHYLIGHFSSNFPEILIRFTNKYSAASLRYGEHLFHVLTGLFAEKSNQVYSELRQYHEEELKAYFLDEYWCFDFSDLKFNPTTNYNTSLQIISWLTTILNTFPSGLKEDIKYYLNQYTQSDTALYNNRIFSEKEIQFFLSTDNVFNSIQLLRILLIEMSFTNKRTTLLIDRLLLLFYSAWDFVFSNTKLESAEVGLDNDAYTINEYLLKYLFHGYLSLIILQETAAFLYKPQPEVEVNTGGRWVLKQLFSKIDSLIASEVITEKSKRYYITNIIEFYFKLPEYLDKQNMEALTALENALLWQLKHSMSSSPFGKPAMFLSMFRKACTSYEFYRNNNKENISRGKKFYDSLLPYTEELEWKICDI